MSELLNRLFGGVCTLSSGEFVLFLVKEII